MATVATRGLGQPRLIERRDLNQRRQLDPLHQQLGDTVTATHDDRRVRVEVDQCDLDFATIPGIDGARTVDNRKPDPRSQSRTRVDETDHSERNGDREAGRHQGALTGRKVDIVDAIEIHPSIALMGAARQRKLRVQTDHSQTGRHGATEYRDRMSGTHVAPPSVRYRERLWAPWWWWPLGFGLAALIALDVNRGVPSLPTWLPFVALFAVATGALLWLGRIEVQVTADGGRTELWAGDAHLPTTAIGRYAEIPSTAKSAALGRQLDPAAFVMHRAWVGPMVLVVVNDPDDPTPYWLVSSRHPERVLSALRS